jgi:hypothetical protein
MSTGIICKIKLDPFYQEFLKGYFDNYEIVFSFPREEIEDLKLVSKFKKLLMNPPNAYKPFPDDERTFLIEVPEMKDKDPLFNNYISECRNEVFTHSIHNAWRNHYHRVICTYRNQDFDYQDCIKTYMDEFKISDQYFDRLVKEYKKWRNLIKVRKFQKRERARANA